jgi:hypothetical protein
MTKLNTWAAIQVQPGDRFRVKTVPVRWRDWLALEIILREAARVGATALECATPNDATDVPGYAMSVTLGGPSSDAVERAHKFNDAVRAALETTPGAWPP